MRDTEGAAKQKPHAGICAGAGGNFRPYRDRGQAQTSSVTRRLMRRERMETKAISTKAIPPAHQPSFSSK